MKHLKSINELYKPLSTLTDEELNEKLDHLYQEKKEIESELEVIYKILAERKLEREGPENVISDYWKSISDQIEAVDPGGELSEYYMPKHVYNFYKEVNDIFDGDLQWISYDNKRGKLEFSLDGYSEKGMNRLDKIVKLLASKYKDKFEYLEDQDSSIVVLDLLHKGPRYEE